MMVHLFGALIRSPPVHKSILYSIPNQNQTQTLTKMVMAEPVTRRPTCPCCSKPISLCLCTRIRTPALDNSVSVTILQHSLEKKHPLNSARIAKLGLKNLTITTVSDVIFGARFVIQPLEMENPIPIVAEIDKRGVITSIMNMNDLGMHLGDILAFLAAGGALANGFVVKKVQKRKVNGSTELEEFEEFELKVPPGSVLLYPSEEAIRVEDMGVDLKVKNMIVLDGTWGKAKRMYRENPWLRVLPHLKLDVKKVSLYSEVRRQPKEICLSTIESIVYSLKAVGDDDGGRLDDLLDVFESMVVDQRRFKDERLGSEQWAPSRT